MDNSVIDVVIACGGEGSRLKQIMPTTPKALVEIDSQTMIERIYKQFHEHGMKRFVFLLGLGAKEIIAHLEAIKLHESEFVYIEERVPLGNGGALLNALPQVRNHFFYVYVDCLMAIDVTRMLQYYYTNKCDFCLFTHPNDHPYDSDLVVTEIDSAKITKLKPHPHSINDFPGNLVNAALMLFHKKCFEGIPINNYEGKIDLVHDILPYLVNNKVGFSYKSPEYLKDMGTPERLNSCILDVKSKKLTLNSINESKKIAFLDRDGCLIEEAGYIVSPEQVKLKAGVIEGLKLLRDSQFMLILVSNQPQVAMGKITIEELGTIHARMEWLLAEHGVYLDQFLYCPHHPEQGHPGEVPSLKISCQCRKPGIGLVNKLDNIGSLNLQKSVMFGDTFRDEGFAENLGVAFQGVSSLESDIKNPHRGLLEAIKSHLGTE